jgi:hypothetical protein
MVQLADRATGRFPVTKRFLTVLLLVFLTALPVSSEEPTSSLTVILTPDRARSLNLDTLIPVLAVNSLGNPVIAVHNNLFALNNSRFLLEEPVSISDCAFTPDGALLLVSGKTLGYCSGGKFHSRMTLPENGMRLAVGPDRLYLFGGDNARATSIYIVEPGQGHAKLCEMPMPVGSASVSGETLYFSVINDIYRLRSGEEVNLICRIPGPAITSMAVANSEKIYFTAGLTLYQWQKGRLAIIGEGLGDKICWQDEALYILNTEKKSLIKLKDIGSTSQWR